MVNVWLPVVGVGLKRDGVMTIVGVPVIVYLMKVARLSVISAWPVTSAFCSGTLAQPPRFLAHSCE